MDLLHQIILIIASLVLLMTLLYTINNYNLNSFDTVYSYTAITVQIFFIYNVFITNNCLLDFLDRLLRLFVPLALFINNKLLLLTVIIVLFIIILLWNIFGGCILISDKEKKINKKSPFMGITADVSAKVLFIVLIIKYYLMS